LVYLEGPRTSVCTRRGRNSTSENLSATRLYYGDEIRCIQKTDRVSRACLSTNRLCLIGGCFTSPNWIIDIRDVKNSKCISTDSIISSVNFSVIVSCAIFPRKPNTIMCEAYPSFRCLLQVVGSKLLCIELHF